MGALVCYSSFLLATAVMHVPNIERLQDELGRLMLEQIDSLKSATFIGRSKEELQQTETRLKRIRELSADLLAAFKREQP